MARPPRVLRARLARRPPPDLAVRRLPARRRAADRDARRAPLGGSPTWTTAIAAPVMLVLFPTPVRSQAFAMPLFAALVWLLARDARQADRRIWLVLPLLVVWANVHGSVLLGCGLVLLRCAVAAAIALRARERRGLRRPARWRSRRSPRRSRRPTGLALPLLPFDGHEQRLPPADRRVGGHDVPRLPGLLRRGGDRARLRPAARGEARSLRERRPRRADAGGARHGPQRRLAAARRRRAAAAALARWSPEPRRARASARCFAAVALAGALGVGAARGGSLIALARVGLAGARG